MRGVGLRPIRPDDEPFLRALYATTRETELAMLPEAMRAAFANSQYDLQERHYRTHYEGATWSVITLGAAPVGRLIVDRTPERWLLVDIAIVPEARRSGIGTALLRELQDEASRAGRGIELSVRVDNPLARELYSRLGFILRAGGGHDHTYITMAWGKGRTG